MFFTECRLFLKRRKLFIMCAVFTAAFIAWILLKGIYYTISYNGDAVQGLGETIKTARIPYVFFLLLSYMYAGENCRSGIEEVIAAAAKGRLRASFYKIMVLQIWNAVITAAGIVLHIILAVRGGKGGCAYLCYGTGLWILYHMLPNFFACLAGLFLSGLRNKRAGYAGLVLTCYVFVGGFAPFLQMMSWKTDVIYRISDVFCIFVRGTSRATSYYYLFSSEGNNWIRILFWILLSGMLLWLQQAGTAGSRGRKMGAGILAATLVGVLCIYTQPFGAAYKEDNRNFHDEWHADQSYYRLQGYSGEVEKAEFRVTDYNMRMTVARELGAEVVMTLDVLDLEEYAFTLYHGYRVKSVRDENGNDLPYDRTKDYLRIGNPSGCLKEIHICYEGYSRNFYSTSQGIWLPAYFAYYPMAGCRRIFEEYDFVIEEEEETAHFHLTLDAPEPVFCSLEQQEDGSYEGDAKGVTLLGSLFAECYCADGYRMIYSDLEYGEDEIKEYDRQLREALPAEMIPSVVFLTHYTMFQYYYADEDQMISWGFTMEDDCERFLENR